MLPKRPERHRVFVWNPKFKTRQEDSYQLEDYQIGHQLHQQIAEDIQNGRQPQRGTVIDAFLRKGRFDLDPPQGAFRSLRAFLKRARESDLHQDPISTEDARLLALVDERCDRTGWISKNKKRYYTRDWLQYSEYPPEGDCRQWNLLHAKGLYERLARLQVSTIHQGVSKSKQPMDVYR